MRPSGRTGFANITAARTFAPFYRLFGDKRVMVYRRRYYYNERPFISVVYFGRLRVSFYRCHLRNYLLHELITNIMTATQNQRWLAVLPAFANISKTAPRATLLIKIHFAINVKRIPVLLS